MLSAERRSFAVCKVPSETLTFKNMKRLLYGRTVQFAMGSCTKEQLPFSEVAVAKATKAKIVEATRKQQSEQDNILFLLLDHLREHLDPGAWYSLPIDVIETLSMQKFDTALTTGLSMSEAARRPSGGLLPIADRSSGSGFQAIQDLEASGGRATAPGTGRSNSSFLRQSVSHSPSHLAILFE